MPAGKNKTNKNMITLKEYDALYPLPETTYSPEGNSEICDAEIPHDMFTPHDYAKYDLKRCIQLWDECVASDGRVLPKWMEEEMRRHARRQARRHGYDIEKREWIPEDQMPPRTLLDKILIAIGFERLPKLAYHRWTTEEIIADGNEKLVAQGKEPELYYQNTVYSEKKYPRIADVLKHPRNQIK